MNIDTNESIDNIKGLGAHLGQDDAGLDDDTSSTPLPPRKAPGYLSFMPPLIKELWDKGADFTLDGKSGEILVEGFYKSSPMRLVIDGTKFTAIDKRGRERAIASYDDLARLNFQWWRRANTRGQVTQPNRSFQEYFLTQKWLKRTVMYVAADVLPPGLVEEDNDD